MTANFMGKKSVCFLSWFFVIALGGCMATRDWVREQLGPLGGKVSNVERRVGEMGGDITQFGGRLSDFEGRLVQTDAKAERALRRLGNLRLERRFVLNLKEGATFDFDSFRLTPETQRQIDGFLSDLKAELKEENSLFLVAGHTDGIGSLDYNYELGRKRADSVARYLILDKKMHPLNILTVSYGEGAPMADNATPQGRRKNRRIEILVYQEAISSGEKGEQAAQMETEKPMLR